MKLRASGRAASAKLTLQFPLSVIIIQLEKWFHKETGCYDLEGRGDCVRGKVGEESVEEIMLFEEQLSTGVCMRGVEGRRFRSVSRSRSAKAELVGDGRQVRVEFLSFLSDEVKVFLLCTSPLAAVLLRKVMIQDRHLGIV